MTVYRTTLLRIQITDLLDKAVSSFETTFGSVRSYPVRKLLLNCIKDDLVRILTDSVNVSLDYFYHGKRRGNMDKYLKKGIQVKGQTLKSVVAMLHGVDYTVTHEENTKVAPTKGRFLAIPLPAACRGDGTPILSHPDRWKLTERTFTISGTEALNTYNRTPAASQINPHSPDQVQYIVYKERDTGNIVFLYKLVPYSYFYEGYTNYKGEALRKLGLRARIETGIRSAIPGWLNLVWDTLESIPDFTDLTAYKGINITTVNETFHSTYNKNVLPKGRIPVSDNLVGNIENFAFMTSDVLTL